MSLLRNLVKIVKNSTKLVSNPTLRTSYNKFQICSAHHPTNNRLCSTNSPAVTTSTDLTTDVDQVPDRLLQQLVLECQSNEKAVLNSYSQFIQMTCSHLSLDLQPIKPVPNVDQRLTLLKSVHVHKKHRVQYEMKTHFLKIVIKHVTGSTADTFLEYVQRMCPENVSMKVTEFELCQFPEPLQQFLSDLDKKKQ